MSKAKVEEFAEKQKEFEELEEKVKNFSLSVVPPEERAVVEELLSLCMDIQRKALEKEREEINKELS